MLRDIMLPLKTITNDLEMVSFSRFSDARFRLYHRQWLATSSALFSVVFELYANILISFQILSCFKLASTRVHSFKFHEWKQSFAKFDKLSRCSLNILQIS